MVNYRTKAVSLPATTFIKQIKKVIWSVGYNSPWGGAEVFSQDEHIDGGD